MKAKKYTNSSWAEGDYEKKYSTATGTYTTLPAEFQTSGADAENYQVFGASSGVGEETKNLFVEGEYSLDRHYLKSDGSTENNQYWSISEYISVSPNTKYTMYNCAGATPGFCWYDANKNYISGDNFNNRSAVTVTSPATAKYVRLSVCTTTYAYGTKNSDVFKLVIGSAYPSYKIPILNTSGNVFNASDSDRIEGFYLNSSGALVANAGWCISGYKNTNPNEIIAIIDTLGSAPSICFYNENKTFISGIAYEGNTPMYATAPPNTKYFRASYGKVVANQVQIIRQSNYDLFIGDSKLYEDEYVDFVEQKLYKYVSGVLTPTDPPLPFPTIHTYIGENNISVDTTVQPEKVTLTVAAWREKEGKEYQNGEWSDNNDT